MGIKRYLFILFLLLFALPSWAADHYVTPTGAGEEDGTSCADGFDWSTMTFTRGDTYYLCTGTYGAKTLNTEASGASYIYLKQYNGTVTFSTVALTISTNYWDISGVTGGGPGSWTTGHGIIFTSAACSDLSYIVLSDGVSYIQISRIKFIEVGNTSACPGCDSSGPTTNGVYCAGSVSNSSFSYLYFDNLSGLPWLLRDGTTNIFEYNYVGDVGNAYVCNVDCHTEALVIHSMDDVHFRYNYLADSPSTGGFVKNASDVSADVRIYGNVFNTGNPISCNTGTATDWRIFNNTFVNISYGPVSGDCTFGGYVYNNLIWEASISVGLLGTHDYNWYSSIDSCSCTMDAGEHENIIVDGCAGCDCITEVSNPFINSSGSTPESFRLVVGAGPKDIGYNICLLDTCTGEKKYNVDAFGTTRPQGSAWDIGAYEYVQSGGFQIGSGIQLGTGVAIQ